uniref:THO complex subunit 3-like n=1 Tax=Phallusia mammillata TaxID=59560 RepID=A0A6F9DU19_9ASCI|nr:THO complex subunit 3-like [Phallusia mammillata]
MVVSVEKLQEHFKSNGKTKEHSAHSAKVHSVAWNCDGKKLASGSYDQTVSVYVLERDRMSKDFTCKGHSDSVDQLCWHPTSSDVFATASGDKTVRIWDARSGKCSSTINTKGENINICWSPNGQSIAVGNKEDLVTFIDTKNFKAKAHEQFKVEVNEIAWNNTNDLFFLTTGQGTVQIYSYPDLKHVQSLYGHTANCICIKFDSTGKYFATGSADALVNLWDVAELVCVRTFSRLDWPVRTLSFSYDGLMLASASEDHFIDISHVETGEKICEVPCDSPTFTVAWHPKIKLLAFACDDKDKYSRDAGTVKIFGLPND